MCISCYLGQHECAEKEAGCHIPCKCTDCHPERVKLPEAKVKKD